MADVPAPWFMRKQLSPAEEVARIGHEAGVTIPPYVAERIASAVLSYADSAEEVRLLVHREEWADEYRQQRIRRGLRMSLLERVATVGRIPIGPPSEAVRYLEMPAYGAGAGREVPAPMVAEGAGYDEVEVSLRVACRTPAVDRAAAVRAGVL
jgi:hypothetical protein